MGEKTELLQGTLDTLVLKTLASMGPLHGYGLARRIEQVSGNTLALNQGTIYPALLRLEQRGWIRSDWGKSENNRRARFYAITPPGTPATHPRHRRLATHRRHHGTLLRAATIAFGMTMSALRILLARLFSRRQRRSDVDIDDEFAAHLEMAAAELRAQGMSAEAAEREARLRFGGLTQQHESLSLPVTSATDRQHRRRPPLCRAPASPQSRLRHRRHRHARARHRRHDSDLQPGAGGSPAFTALWPRGAVGLSLHSQCAHSRSGGSHDSHQCRLPRHPAEQPLLHRYDSVPPGGLQPLNRFSGGARRSGQSRRPVLLHSGAGAPTRSRHQR